VQGTAPFEIAGGSTETSTAVRSVRVFMMDLLSIVPYYTGHLCEALERRADISLELGAIRYYLDPECFARMGLRTSPGLDLVSRMSRLPRLLRRPLKTIECLLNLHYLSVRFALRKPDIVHVQFVPMVLFGLPFEPWFLRFLKSLGIKIVYTVHNILPHESGERHRSLYGQLYSLADRLICHDSAAQQRLVKEFDCDIRRISVIPHGPLLVPSQQTNQAAARQRLGISLDVPLVLWQGILRPYKGVDFLLQAWQQVSKNSPRACLAIVGTGDDALTSQIRKQVVELGLSSNVQLTLRFISVSELEDIHTAADILVYPYAEATTSGALLTGVGYGKAIVASRLPAFERILKDEDNGLLVTYGDTEQFAKQLQRLIADPDLRDRLGNRLRHCRTQELNWNDIAKRTAACYATLLEVPA
jgi:glycosyltransferase involved in cell wall biosynthesis